MTPEQTTRELLRAAGFPMQKLDPKGLDYFLYVEKKTPEQILNIYLRSIPERES
jgi:hypothetical protein